MLIAEEFVLLCLDDTSGTSTFGVVYEPARAGPLLGELALRERVDAPPDGRGTLDRSRPRRPRRHADGRIDLDFATGHIELSAWRSEAH